MIPYEFPKSASSVAFLMKMQSCSDVYILMTQTPNYQIFPFHLMYTYSHTLTGLLGLWFAFVSRQSYSKPLKIDDLGTYCFNKIIDSRFKTSIS